MKKKEVELTEKKIVNIFSNIINNNSLPNYIDLKSGDDDCALINIDKINDSKNNHYIPSSLLCSSDMLHRQTDFPLIMTYYQIGWMSFVVNLSDIASMGGCPIAFLFSIGVPKTISLKHIKQIATGLQDCSKIFQTPIIGGDTDNHRELTISGTILGIKSKKVITRSGASIGDCVCVTGYLGLAGLALDIIKLNIDNKINKEFNLLYKHLFEPCPRIQEGLQLSKFELATSMIDTSDSLAQSLHELSLKSHVGFEINESLLPLNVELLNQLSLYKFSNLQKKTLDYILYSGGDFELLFTINKNNINLLKKIETKINKYFEKQFLFNPKYDILRHKYPVKITIIGKVVPLEYGISIINNKKEKKIILEKGYDSFL